MVWPRFPVQSQIIAFIMFAALMLVSPSAAQDRHALVIGIDTYAHVENLRKARNDARAMATALEQQGFETILRLDSDLPGLLSALNDLVQTIEQGDEVVFYYAGHGVEIGGQNYLLPADIPSLDPGREMMVERLAVPLNAVVETIRAKGARVSVLIIDACRDNPFARRGTRSLGGTRGLSRADPPEGTFILYSAGAGQAAMDELPDNDPNPNSVFTRSLLEHIGRPGVELRDMVQGLRLEVRDLALSIGHQQSPAYYDQLFGEFYFYQDQNLSELVRRQATRIEELEASLLAAETLLTNGVPARLAQAAAVEALRERLRRQFLLITQLRRQVAELQDLLGESRARESETNTQIETLGSNLNSALARLAADERRRAELEQAQRQRLEAD